MGKPQKKSPVPKKIVRVREHRTPLAWMLKEIKGDYTQRHACGFCGASAFAHKSVRPAATVFCDPTCARLYKRTREHAL